MNIGGTDLESGVYEAGENQDVTITYDAAGYAFPADRNYVILVDGDLNIEKNLTIPLSTTVMFVASGDINVDPRVTELHGIYSANVNFEAEGTDPAIETPLLIEGNIIANAGYNTSGRFINNRDLDIDNNTTPSVTFKYRPDFVLNSPEFLRSSGYLINEAAPPGN